MASGIFAHFDMKMFLIGIVAGIIASYVIKPEKRVIVKYPEPGKADKLVYRDTNGVCFKFKTEPVNCDANEDKISEFPVQN